MKKTQSPLVVRSGNIRKLNSTISSSNHRKSHRVSLNPVSIYIKTAAKRIGGIFSVVFSKLKKAGSGSSRDQVQQNNPGGSSSFVGNSAGDDSRKSSRSRYSNYGTSPEIEIDTALLRSSLSFKDIYKATENFSTANQIGEGGFGTVYKGKLKDGSVFAVKRAKTETSDQRLSVEFKNEIVALSKIEHMSLVRFYGYIEHGNEQLIVVEYVSNGNLREHLDGTRGSGLEIGERLDIAIDVAHAVTYLHTYSDPPIIHRDIKASNILITENLRAKVADFGFARMVSEDPTATHISTQIKGTAGYLDPEYLRTYQLTEKSDVYSFGVLLIEIVTGRQPIESKRSLNERITTRWALRRLKDGEVVVAMDPRLQRSLASIQAVEEVLKLARQCLASSRISRPSMRKCAEVLWQIRKEYKDKTINNSLHSATVVERYARSSRRNAFGIDDGDSLMFVSA
ncbi:hypothetical protein ABFX02_14G074600 [Erythranthe guttata]